MRLGPVEGLRVAGGGAAFPERTLSNEDVLRHLVAIGACRPMEDERLVFMANGLAETTGVSSRAWAHMVGAPFDHATETTTADLGALAARRALADAGLAAKDVDLVLCSTSTPHRMTSTTSAAIGAAIGTSSACMDVRTGCSAVLFALTTAALHLAAGVSTVLVVGTETFSKVVPPTNRLAAMSLGDGAGAVVLTRGGGRLLASYLDTDGTLGRLVSTDGALPPTAAEIERGGYVLSGTPDELLATIPGKYTTAIRGVLGHAGLEPGAIDAFVPHQTSVTLIAEIARACGLPPEKTFVNVPRHANVGAAGCIVALVEARAEGRLPQGAKVLLSAVGGGMSWGALVLET